MTAAPLALAHLLDRRLHATLERPFHLPAARLYGFTDHDPLDGTTEEVARVTFLGEDLDVYDLLGGSLGLVAASFDAAAIATTGWAAPLLPERDEWGQLTTGVRPSRHPDRVRIRLVAVVSDAGIASVMRREDRADDPVELPARGEGALADALDDLWFGDPLTGAVPAADRGRRGRHLRPRRSH